MPFTIVRQDITKMNTDAIVNAANTNLTMGGGVCGAIFAAAGPRKLQEACQKMAPIRTGEAVITPGFSLPAKYIIHTAGPVYHPWNAGKCESLLRSSYLESLRLAAENDCESIAFPLISSGIFGYPKENALQVAASAIREFLADHDMDIYLAVFDKAAFAVSKSLTGKVASYISQHYVDSHEFTRDAPVAMSSSASSPLPTSAPFSRFLRRNNETMPYTAAPPPEKANLTQMLNSLDEPFSAALLRLVDAKGKTDAEVYKRANLDRRLFSKIRTGKNYTPSKRTILALAVALELNLKETGDLLGRAGYALSHSQKFDVILEYFIVNGKYDIFEINEVLFHYELPLLGG